MNSGKQWMAVVILLACSVAGVAQTSPDLEQGMKPYGSYHGGNLDNISLTNGNLYFEAPLFSYSQRGDLAYPIVLRYNNKNFSLYQPPCPPPTHCPVRQTVIFGPSPLGGDSSSDGASVTLGFAGYPTTGAAAINSSLSFNGNAIFYNSNSVVGPDGAAHQLVTTSSGAVTADGSGFAVNSRGLVDRNGTLSGGLTAEDRNGNQISINANTTISSDTLGRQFPLAPGPTLPANTPPASTAPLTSCPALGYSHQPVSYAYYWNLPAPNTPPSTGSMQLVVCYASVYVRTNIFGGATGPNLFDVSSTFYMLQSVVFPDQTYWAFQYDAADPNNTASYGFGDLLKVSLPIGGSLSYTWGGGGYCGSGYSRTVLTRTVDANDGTGPHTWTYNGGVVTDPLGNDTVHTITHLGGTCSLYETQTQYYQGSHTGGTLLKTVNTDYQYTVNPYDGAVIASNGVQSLATSVTNVFPIRVTTTLSNGLVSKVETDYDTALAYHGPLDGITSNQLECPPPTDPPIGCFYGNQITNGVTNYTGSYGKVMAKREYDWGHGAPGPLLRQTIYSYQWQNGTNAASYLSNNFLDLVSTAIVYDGASNQVAKTTYAYDESTLGSSNIATQRNSNPGNGLIRGNQTTVSHWLNTSNSMISSHAAYFDTGELQSSTDPLNHTTTHLYDSAYAGAFSTQTCSPSTGGVTHCVSGTYDSNTGLLTSLTNENATTQASGNSPGDSAHTSSFIYDLYWRLLSAKAPPDPANGNMQDSTTFTYALSPLMVTRQKSVTTGLNDFASAYFDGVGRGFKSTHALPNGTATTVTVFDAAGRTSSVTNPYFTTSDPTYGVTSSQYDGIGRTTQVIKQDGSISQVKYNVPNSMALNADCTTTTDEAGKQRGACTDALGRLVEVDEPYASGLLVNNYATMQTGGNFVLFNSANSAVWSTGTNGTNAGSIFMQDDGNLVLYIFKWSAGVYAAPTPGNYPTQTCSIGTYLIAGQRINANQCIVSPHGQYMLYMAPDGNFYIYDIAHNVATWGAGTYGHSGAYATMQTDGNLVVYASNGVALWNSGTSGTGAERLDMEDDGRIIIYKSAWNSGTSTGQFNWSQLAHPGCDIGIGTGTTGMLGAGQCFVSPNGHFELLLQTDGNLVIYDLGATPAAARWSTGTGVSPVDPGYSMRTLYSYDTLGNLLRVEQDGGTTDSSQWRVRVFTYNSLSQLLTATNPESGTISYLYDNDGNLLQKTSPAPNQTGTATQTVSYCYDELHRITGKGYGAQSCPLATPVVTYAYDSGANAKGHLVSMTDQAGTATYTYDVLGRMSTETRTLTGANNGAISKTVSYEYNLDGALKVLHYPSGAAVTYTPDSAARMISAVDSSSATNYVTGATYDATSALTGFVSGSGGAAAITNAFTYNKRLQPVTMSATVSSQTVLSIGYDFHLGNGDNGNVYGITNYKDSSRNQTFTYDGLNRLTSAQNAGTDCTAKVLQNKTKYWGNSYTYDAWGNLLGKTVTKCGAENLNLTADAHNWIHGTGTDYRYDVAGNMTYDATSSLNYTFDQENRLTGASGYTYTYDGDGNRVRKSNGNLASNGTLYWYMSPGVVAETDLAGTLKSEYVFFDGERVARRDGATGTGGVFYYFSDHLKTASIITDSVGTIKAESDYYPWGGELQFVNNDSNDYKFTGKKRDTETGLDYFGARYYSNGLGRFISADWSQVIVPVPYANFGDPQTLNQYSYVRNIPTVKVDADGHEGGYTYNANGSMTAPTEATTDGHPIRDTVALGVGTVVSLALPGAGTLVQNLFGVGLATAPVTVPIAADIIEGATPGAPGPKLPAASTLGKAEQLAVNAEKGAATETKTLSSVPESIPAGPGARPSPSQQSAINEMGEAHGCSTCGATTPGTKSGNWVGDHQPSTSVNPPGNPQTYRPQCLTCSLRQGGQLRAAQAKAAAAARRAAAAAEAAKKQQQTN